jgi:hypothetical protein
MYGKSFCDAAKDTWKMIKSNGIDAIINDNLINSVLTIGCILVGFVTGGVTYGIGAAMFSSNYNQMMTLIIICAILCGFVGTSQWWWCDGSVGDDEFGHHDNHVWCRHDVCVCR